MPRRRLYSRRLYEACTRPVRGLYEKHFYFKMLITFEPNVAQRSVISQNDHKSKACLPEASNTAFTMYRRLNRRLRRLYEAPFFLAPDSSNPHPTTSQYFMEILDFIQRNTEKVLRKKCPGSSTPCHFTILYRNTRFYSEKY